MSQLLEYIKIALMNIKSNKGRSLLTMLGIIIGISSVIMLISIGNGVKGQITEELDNMAGGQIYLYVDQKKGETDYISFNEDDFQMIQEEIPHVLGVTPDWSFWGASAEGRKGSVDLNLTCGNEYEQYVKKDPIIRGKYFTKSDCDAGNDVCVISEEGARQLFGNLDVIGVPVEVTLYNVTRELTIVGVRKANASKMASMMYGNNIGMEIPMSVLANYGYYVGEYDGMSVIGESAQYSTEIAKKCVKLLEAKYGLRGEDLIHVQDFNDSMSQITSILNYITIFVSFVAAISLLVGGIGVMNIMLVSVTERTREIGIRKALGARTASIMMQFLSESAIITLVGGIIGIVLGILGAIGVCTLIGFTAAIDPVIIVIATVFSSGVGIFFGIYPAKKAAKLSPIEALRHE